MSDAEFDEDHSTETRLNEIHEAPENVFTLIESDGISASSLQTMMQIYDNLREPDSNFNAFEFLAIAPEEGFNQPAVEPETESFLSPDPPLGFDVENMGAPFEPRSPEDMALWMIGRLSERLKPAMLQGLSSKVQGCVAQREVMVSICRHCQEHPEKRSEVWMMMQSLNDLSSSDEEDAKFCSTTSLFQIPTHKVSWKGGVRNSPFCPIDGGSLEGFSVVSVHIIGCA